MKEVPLAKVEPIPAAQQQMQRKIIRNGQMEFEVDSFDSSAMQISKIVTEEGGFLSSTDSEKLSNGKVKGTITLRVPPDHLDTLVLKLRGLGDLKNQKIAAQDITKQFTDLESGLRAARTMETRLLDIIKTGKGEVKDLVEAEKQLGLYREKIEQIEGELRYYENMVSLSTLNVTLMERDIKGPTSAFESELVQAGIEVEDVEKARTDALKAIEDAKGRVIQSDLKRLDAGQLTASIVCEIAPEGTGPLTDRLKQLGRVARLEAERKQTTTGGTGAPASVVKMERHATRFNISLYNLANIAPRETVNLTIAAEDVEKAYKAILIAMKGDDTAKIGRIVSSTLNNPKPDQITGAISLEVKSENVAAIDAAIRATGDVLNLSVSENADTNNVTRAKRGYSISLLSMAQVPPRETQTIQIVTRNVPATYAKLLSAMKDSKQPSRVLSSQLSEQDRQNISGQLDVEVAPGAVGLVDAALTGTDSEVLQRMVSRASDAQNTLDTKVRLSVSIVAADRFAARETRTLQIAAKDVPATYNKLLAAVQDTKQPSRVLLSQLNEQDRQNVTGQVEVEVPRSAVAVVETTLTGSDSDVFSRNVSRANDTQNTLDSKVKLSITLIAADRLAPRETTTMWLEVGDVEKTLGDVIGTSDTAGGRTVERQMTKEKGGKVTAHVTIDVPLSGAAVTADRLRSLGIVRVVESSKNPQVPDGPLARARFEVTAGGAQPIISAEDGVGARLSQGLRTSLNGLTFSLMLLVIGVCLVGPFALAIWVGWKLWKRGKVKSA